MRTIKFILIFVQLSLTQVWAQNESRLTYFNLSIQAEEEDLKANSFVSAYFTPLNLISINSYSGTDQGLVTLAKIIKSLASSKQSDYSDYSYKKDTTIISSYSFYSTFVSHSTNPEVYGRVSLGIFNIYYVKLEDGFPLMAFSFRNQNGNYLNNPEILELPATIALTDAINKSFLYPKIFKPQNKLNSVSNYTIVRFDTINNEFCEGFEFFLNISNVSFNTIDSRDTASVFDKRFKTVLEFYRLTLTYLSEGNIDKYYQSLSIESKQRIYSTLNESGDIGLNYYKKYKSSFSQVFKIIDLGDVKLLLVANPLFKKVKAAQYVYIRTGAELKWINENQEFYFEDLLRTEKFIKVLY